MEIRSHLSPNRTLAISPPVKFRNKQSINFTSLKVYHSPLVEQNNPIMFDWHLSQFCKTILTSIELVLVKKNRVGFRLIGCQCPHIESDGLSIQGFVYRPASIKEFCAYLPVFLVHLRDDKCQNQSLGILGKQLEACYHCWTQGELSFREFCSNYFYNLGLREIAGISGIFVTNAEQSAPSSIEDYDMMNEAVASAFSTLITNKKQQPKGFQIKLALPEAFALLYEWNNNIPQLILFIIQSLELLQQSFLVVRCRYCSQSILVDSVSSMPGDVIDFFLYHHIDTCHRIPNKQNMLQHIPFKFSQEYFSNRAYMTKYINILQQLVGFVDCKSATGESNAVILSKF